MFSGIRGILLAFLLGAGLVGILLGIYYLAGGGDDAAAPATPTPTPQVGQYPTLADGQFLDSIHWIGVPGPLNPPSLESIAAESEAVVVVKITSITGKQIPTPGPNQATSPARNAQPVPWTTYTAHIEKWIEGSGDADTTITMTGGVDYDGARVLNYAFLPQVGRTYIMVLRPNNGKIYGDGTWEGAPYGTTAVEVTDGKVHVLDDEKAQAALGDHQGESLDDFLTTVAAWASATPVPRTPTPTPIHVNSPTPSG